MIRGKGQGAAQTPRANHSFGVTAAPSAFCVTPAGFANAPLPLQVAAAALHAPTMRLLKEGGGVDSTVHQARKPGPTTVVREELPFIAAPCRAKPGASQQPRCSPVFTPPCAFFCGNLPYGVAPHLHRRPCRYHPCSCRSSGYRPPHSCHSGAARRRASPNADGRR